MSGAHPTVWPVEKCLEQLTEVHAYTSDPRIEDYVGEAIASIVTDLSDEQINALPGEVTDYLLELGVLDPEGDAGDADGDGL